MRNRRVTVQLTKSEAAALIDFVNGDAFCLPALNDRADPGVLVGVACRKLIDALARAVALDAERRAA